MRLLLAAAFAALGFVLILYSAFLPCSHAAARQDMCPVWAAQMAQSDPNGDHIYALHVLGCHAPWGAWRRADGRCPRYAYHVALHATTADDVYRSMARKGCVLYEDGSWGAE